MWSYAMKKYLFALLHALDVTRFASWYHRKRVMFLCYHGVTKRPTRSPADPKGLHVNHRRFEAQLDFLQSHYKIISLADYLSARSGRNQLPYYSAVLTFDDGFRNFLTVAAPIMAAREIPATVFLITDKAGEAISSEPIRKEWCSEDDESHLSWADARTLKDDFKFQMGSHTCSHSGLLTLSAKETERELLHSANDLATHLAVENPSLSYPKGQYSRLLADKARKLGYACAVTTDRGPNELDHDLFTLGRTMIGDDDDLASFAVRVSGLRWWLARIWAPFRARPSAESHTVSASAATPTLELVD
jgi:peptidoglycan/xylan/chitin deacetylase (PgdA/CDA1 family)